LTGTDFGNGCIGGGGGGGGVSDGGGGGGASDEVGGVSTGGGGGKSANDDSDSDAAADAVDTDDTDVWGIDGIGGGAIDDDEEEDNLGVVDFLISISPVSPVFRRIPLLTDGSDKTLILADDGNELRTSSILTLGVRLSGAVDNEKTDDTFDGVFCFDDTGLALGGSLILDFSLTFIGVTGTSGD
jgi:hypothetical protein